MYNGLSKVSASIRRFKRPATEAPLQGFSPITRLSSEDIFIVGYPKSGNTWFQNLVAGVCYGVDPRLSPSALTQHLVPDLSIQKWYQRYRTPTFFKSHALPCPEYRRVVYLLRDGRDVMVSYRHFREAVDHVAYDFLEFVSPGSELYPCHWAHHVDAWMQNPYDAHMLLIKYEDLLADPVRQLESFCQFAGIARETKHLEVIAKAASFRNLREKEVREDVGQPDRVFLPGALFFRRGIVGSYKDEMPPEVLSRFLGHSAQTLRRHGYLLNSPEDEDSGVKTRACGLSPPGSPDARDLPCSPIKSLIPRSRDVKREL